MSIGFIIEKKIGMLLTSWVGIINDKVMLESFKKFIENEPDWNPKLHHIADLTEADVSNLTLKGIYKLSRLMKDNTIRGSRRVAVIAEQDSDFRASELYRSFFKQEDRDIEIFENIEDAIDWFKKGYREDGL